MSAISGGGHYISDGEIMGWLAKEQDRIYGELDKSMDLSDKRAKFADDLNNIKAELQQANDSKNFTKVDADLHDLMKTYGSDPELGVLCQGLQGMADKIHTDCQAQQTYQDSRATYAAQVQAFTAAGGNMAGMGVQPYVTNGHASVLIKPEEPVKPPEQHYSDDDMKSWQDLIGGKLDVSGKNDQLTMIHIQELKATLDQSSQLGSTFISSGDKTNSAIINNIA